MSQFLLIPIECFNSVWDMARSGAHLALLLLGGFRSLADAATAELAERGYPDFRPVHDFAMRSIAAGADSASELGRKLTISKQAAAKTILVLQERGFVTRDADPLDARRKRLQVTALGWKVLHTGEAIFDELRQKWETRVGANEIMKIEKTLDKLLGPPPDSFQISEE